MSDNWMALLVAILTDNDVKKSFELVQHGGKVRKFTQTEKKEILQLRKDGKRIVDIAKQYDVSRQQVADLIRHNSEKIQG